MSWTADGRLRCAWPGTWAGADAALYRDYHDREWGTPCHDETALFELLCLEGAQAGLAWITILRKRENYRKAFAGFSVEAVATFGPSDIERLLTDPGIVRNRLKIAAAIGNARAWLDLRARHGDVGAFLWDFVGGRPVRNQWTEMLQVPATTRQSDAMSKALRQAGFRFVGTTICQAFMQACGMFNDHTVDCFRHAELATTVVDSRTGSDASSALS